MFSSIGPVDDPLYLLENAHCFKQVRELSNKPVKSKPKVCIKHSI